jgi:hypothetical protein
MSDQTPLSINEALDLIRSATPDAPAPDPAPTEPSPEPEAIEPQEMAADEPAEADAPDESGADSGKEIEAEAEEIEAEAEPDAEPEMIEMPQTLRQNEAGEWEMVVKVDGEEHYVSLDEIRENHQKKEAADRRFQEASTKAKENREKQAQINAQLQAYQENLMAMQQELLAVQAASQLTPEQEAQLADADPKALLQIKELQKARESKLAELQQQQMAARQQEVQYQAQRAMELLPDWSDPETLNREREGIVQTALHAGFTQDEIMNDITDARLLPVFLNAWKYEQMQKGQSQAKAKRVAPKKVVRKKAPVAAEPTKQKRQREAMSKLSKTGKFDDALNVLLSRQG